MNKADKELLLRAHCALTDWIRYYAPEQFNPKSIEETRKRVEADGSWLAYTARVLAALKEAMK